MRDRCVVLARIHRGRLAALRSASEASVTRHVLSSQYNTLANLPVSAPMRLNQIALFAMLGTRFSVGHRRELRDRTKGSVSNLIQCCHSLDRGSFYPPGRTFRPVVKPTLFRANRSSGTPVCR